MCLFYKIVEFVRRLIRAISVFATQIMGLFTIRHIIPLAR